MLRFLVSLALAAMVFGSSAPSVAQVADFEERAPEKIAAGQTDFWARTLALDATQVQALDAINKRYAATSSSAAKADVPERDKRAALDKADTDKSAEIVAILTPEQRDRYLAMTQRMRDIVEQGRR